VGERAAKRKRRFDPAEARCYRRVMRIIFMGAPEFATPTLAALVGRGHDVAAAYTRAPTPAGRRGLDLTRTPVHRLADRLAVPVRTPSTLRREAEQQAFADLRADVAVVVAYGLILPKAILEATALGCFNLHASLLPRWRGAAPIQRAIMAGDRETGVAVMRMDEGLDTGPIALETRIAVPTTSTAGDVGRQLAAIGADLMARALEMLGEGELPLRVQAASGATYAHKIEKGEARIDWRQPATRVRDHIHGLSPAPGAYSEINLGTGLERVKILRAEVVPGPDASVAPGSIVAEGPLVTCGEGAIRIVQAQRAGRAVMSGADFQRGVRVQGASFVQIDSG
jgi:methionyl-tRNA formyltransferase